MKMNNNPVVAILDQFVEKGKTITYMTAYLNEYDDGRMPNSIAVFKIRLKHKYSIMEKLFPSKLNKIINYQITANQVC